jgi:four helix bundle protein
MGRDGGGRAISGHRELEVYRRAFSAAMRLFELSMKFPREEAYSLTDQIRRASRSVCANIAEAWRKRRYPAAFVSKLNDAETEAGETQVWLEFAVRCGYLTVEDGRELYEIYAGIIGTLIGITNHSDEWTLSSNQGGRGASSGHHPRADAAK